MIKVDANDFGQMATALKSAEKELVKGVRKALRDTARPVGLAVIRTGSERMPAKGGLRDRLESGKVGVLASFGNSPKVTLKLTDRKGDGLDALNRGTLRHPVYPRQGIRARWVSQKVPAGTYTEAFEAAEPLVKRKVLDAMQDVLDDAARKV